MTSPNSTPNPDETLIAEAFVADASAVQAETVATRSLAERIAERVASRFGRPGALAVGAAAVIYGISSAQDGGGEFCGHAESSSSAIDDF